MKWNHEFNPKFWYDTCNKIWNGFNSQNFDAFSTCSLPASTVPKDATEERAKLIISCHRALEPENYVRMFCTFWIGHAVLANETGRMNKNASKKVDQCLDPQVTLIACQQTRGVGSPSVAFQGHIEVVFLSWWTIYKKEKQKTEYGYAGFLGGSKLSACFLQTKHGSCPPLDAAGFAWPPGFASPDRADPRNRLGHRPLDFESTAWKGSHDFVFWKDFCLTQVFSLGFWEEKGSKSGPVVWSGQHRLIWPNNDLDWSFGALAIRHGYKISQSIFKPDLSSKNNLTCNSEKKKKIINNKR